MSQRHVPVLLSRCLAVAFLVAWPLSAVGAAEGDAELGRELFDDLCAPCHGRNMVSPGGITFDLRKFPRDDEKRFRNGVLTGKGVAMPPWRGRITDEDVSNLWAYVRSGG